jgi:DNA-binding MarR family transcriptional regulator
MSTPELEASELGAAILATRDIWLLTGELTGQALAGYGLTSATFQALWAIDPAEPPPSMKLMAERLYCNASNFTFIANQLTERGLVTRDVDPEDRRSRVLILTPEGQRVRDELVRTSLKMSPLATLSPADLHQLLGLLGRAMGSV